jgi:hypothetical protein
MQLGSENLAQSRSRVQQTAPSLGRFGWKRFCKDNKLKKGDVRTFNVIKTLLWHVDISRCKQNKNSVPHIFELPTNGLNVKLVLM